MFWIFVGSLLVLGVPMVINWAYMYGERYPIILTFWQPEAVLAYYGSVLGAAITALSLFFTIRFTRKQLQRDSYIKNEREKWEKIENTIGNILNEINPMPILKQEMGSGLTDPTLAINLFQKYQISCRTATDMLMTCVNTADYVNIEKLVNDITDTANILFQVSQKKIDQYNRQQQLEKRKLTQELLQIEHNKPGSLSAEEIAAHQKTIEDTNCISFKDIMNEMQKVNDEFVHIYDMRFRPLLQQKGVTFEVINKKIQENADAILSLDGNESCSSVNESEKAK